MRRLVVVLLPLVVLGCQAPISTGPDCEENPDAELCQQQEDDEPVLPARLYVDPPFGTGFECVAIGCVEERTFTIENRGGRDVRITLVRTSVDTSTEFSVALHPIVDTLVDRERTLSFPSVDDPLVLKAGARAAAVVHYAPDDANADEGALILEWYDAENDYDDAVVSEVILPLTTRVLGDPYAELETPALNFGYVVPGQTKTLSVVVTNTTDGNATLEVQAPVFASGTPGTFVVDMGDAVFVAAGETLEIPVHYTPSTMTASFGALYFATNDGAHPQLAVQLKGTAISDPWYELVTPASFVADFGDIRIGDLREALVGYGTLDARGEAVVRWTVAERPGGGWPGLQALVFPGGAHDRNVATAAFYFEPR